MCGSGGAHCADAGVFGRFRVESSCVGSSRRHDLTQVRTLGRVKRLREYASRRLQ